MTAAADTEEKLNFADRPPNPLVMVTLLIYLPIWVCREYNE